MISRDLLISKLGKNSTFFFLFVLLVGGWNLSGIDKPVANSEDITILYANHVFDETIDFNNDGSKYVITSIYLKNTGLILDVSEPQIFESATLFNQTLVSEDDANDTNLDRITMFRWSPNDQYIVTAEQNSRIAIWDVSTNTPSIAQALTVIDNSTWTFWDIVWSPDSQKVAISLVNTTVIIWDVLTGNIDKSFHFQSRLARKIQWSPDGRHLAFINGSSDGSHQTLFTIDLNNDEYTKFYPSLTSAISLQWSEDDQILTMGDFGEINVWNFKTEKVIRNLNLEERSYSAYFLDSDKVVISEDRDSKYSRIVSLSDNKILTRFRGTVVHVDKEDYSLLLLWNYYLTRVDYSNVKRDYNIFRFVVVSGYTMLTLAIIPWTLSLIGLRRKADHNVYLN